MNRQPLGGLRVFVGCMLFFLPRKAASRGPWFGSWSPDSGLRYLKLVTVRAAVTPRVQVTAEYHADGAGCHLARRWEDRS
jgi:hypothetical protein